MRDSQPSDRPKRSNKWLWFVAGGVVGFGAYMVMRHPLRSADALVRARFTSLGAEAHEIPWPGGTLTYYMLGRGEEPLVLVHGLSDAPQFWSAVLPGLLDRYRICMPVLPGHLGTSTPQPLALGHCVQAVDAAILHAFGGRRVHLVGFSLGGWVSSLFAAVASERLQSLTLINPAGLSEKRDHTLLRPTTNDEARRAMRTLFGKKIARMAPKIVVEGYRRDIAHQVDFSVIELATTAPKPTEALGRITAPTRVIVGEKDRLILPEEGRAYAESIPNAALHVVEGGTHVLHATDVPVITRLLAETADVAPALPAE